MAISPAALAKGHGYSTTRVNSPCGQCESDEYNRTGRNVLVLTCRYDSDDCDCGCQD